MTLSWDGAHYAEHTAHHRAYDHVLLSRLGAPQDGLAVLDVGCGVGDFTAGLLDQAALPSASVRGVDADPSMIEQARRQHGHRVAFDVCPAQELDQLLPHDAFDLVVSTACLHWLPRADHPAFLAAARTVLADGGRLLVEFGGHGQLADVREVLDPLAVAAGGQPPTWWFPHPDQYRPLLEDAGFSVAECTLITQPRAMADAQALHGWLTSQVLVGYRPHIPAPAWDVFVEGALAGVTTLVEQADGTCDVNYVRLLVDASVA